MPGSVFFGYSRRLIEELRKLGIGRLKEQRDDAASRDDSDYDNIILTAFVILIKVDIN